MLWRKLAVGAAVALFLVLALWQLRWVLALVASAIDRPRDESAYLTPLRCPPYSFHDFIVSQTPYRKSGDRGRRNEIAGRQRIASPGLRSDQFLARTAAGSASGLFPD